MARFSKKKIINYFQRHKAVGSDFLADKLGISR